MSRIKSHMIYSIKINYHVLLITDATLFKTLPPQSNVVTNAEAFSTILSSIFLFQQ